MSDRPPRFCLDIRVMEMPEQNKTYISADCQVWLGDEYHTTYKFIDLVPGIMPDQAELTTMESFASHSSRVAARMLDEHLFEAVSQVRVHRRDDYR